MIHLFKLQNDGLPERSVLRHLLTRAMSTFRYQNVFSLWSRIKVSLGPTYNIALKAQLEDLLQIETALTVPENQRLFYFSTWKLIPSLKM